MWKAVTEKKKTSLLGVSVQIAISVALSTESTVTAKKEVFCIEDEMRKNKRGKPYQDPLQWVRKCRVKSPDGLIYHATKAPSGLCKCGVMLELKPRTDDFIFPSISRANHAISHTLKFLNNSGIDKPIDQFIIEPL